MPGVEEHLVPVTPARSQAMRRSEVRADLSADVIVLRVGRRGCPGVHYDGGSAASRQEVEHPAVEPKRADA